MKSSLHAGSFKAQGLSEAINPIPKMLNNIFTTLATKVQYK